MIDVDAQLIAESMIVPLPAESKEPPAVDEVEQPDLVAPILARLADIPHDKMKQAVLKEVDALAELDKVQFAQFCAAVPGLSGRWIDSDLRPAVKARQTPKAGAISESANVTWKHYVEAAERLGYSFRLNDLSNKVEINGAPVDDVTEARLLSELHALGLRNVEVGRRAFVTRAAEDRYHPIKEYLEGIQWDGADHIAALSQYLPDVHEPVVYADQTKRTVFHAFFRRWLIGAVAKVYDSRKGQNAMLILDGAQGRGKSYFVQWLCPLPGLQVEAPIKPEDKDFLETLTTKWIWEVGELGATIRKADREALKAFLTLQEATYRPAYGRYTVSKPALASCIGTVNMENGFLNDPTGNRRFWPLTLSTIDWAYPAKIDVNQIWAQAYALYRAGEPWALCPSEKSVHEQICTLFEIEDPYAERVLEHFDIIPVGRLTNDVITDDDWFMTTTKIAEHLAEQAKLRPSSDTAFLMALSTTLQRLGVEKLFKRNPSRRGYVGIRKKNGQVKAVSNDPRA